MAWLTPELYRCNLCRGEPTLRRLANFREVANRPGKRPAMSEAHTRVVRAAFARPGETCSEAMVREVMAAHSVPLAMVALRVTELRNTVVPSRCPPASRSARSSDLTARSSRLSGC